MEKKARLLIFIIIMLIIITIGLGGFVIYDKLIKGDKEKFDCPPQNCEVETCTCPNATCDKVGVPGEQMLYSQMGKVYISNSGEVYFNPSERINNEGEIIDMTIYAKRLLGEPKNHNVKSDKFIGGESRTFSYKLDLQNVRSVSEAYFGNGECNFTLLFVHNNGNVSELSYSDDYSDRLKLFKNVSGYSNIVSVVVDQSEGGNGARLYDNCGNGIDYMSPRFK